MHMLLQLQQAAGQCPVFVQAAAVMGVKLQHAAGGNLLHLIASLSMHVASGVFFQTAG